MAARDLKTWGSVNQSTVIRKGSTLTPQHILNSTKHAKKDENCESIKTKPGDSENDHTVFESVAPSKLADIKQKLTVKTTHTTVYTKQGCRNSQIFDASASSSS